MVYLCLYIRERLKSAKGEGNGKVPALYIDEFVYWCRSRLEEGQTSLLI